MLGLLYNVPQPVPDIYRENRRWRRLSPCWADFHAIYALFLIPGFLRKIILYRVLMGVAIIVLGYGGVVTHIINIFTQPQVYASMLAWAGAVGINLFGLVLNVIAVLGKFKVPAK